jgi:hypothetical protein
MKTIKLLTLTMVAGSLLAFTARAGILGSPHDFHSQSWNTDLGDPNTVCGVCHVPHHADSSVVPLWGHQTTSSAFKMYNQANVPVSSMQAAVAAQPNGPSLACLSCHDGTVAINTYGGSPQYGGQPWAPQAPGSQAVYITNNANLGTDLTHSHPISFTYNATLVGTGPNQDQWLYNPDTQAYLTPDSGIFVPGNSLTINGFLLNGNHTVECTSCHDVHNQEGTPYDTTRNPHLVKIVGTQAGVGSLLCRSCHNK